MASNRSSASNGENTEWNEHIKTYNGFIWLLKYLAGFSALTLVMLYLIFAR